MPYPTTSSASDVWSMRDVYKAVAGDNWPASVISDPNFNLVTLLLNTDGVDGGQNNTFTDSSSSAHTITRGGNTTQGSVNPFGDEWSVRFDVNTDYTRTPTTADFSLSTNDFCYEGWIWADDPFAQNYPRFFGLGPYYNNVNTFGIIFRDNENSNYITAYWNDGTQARKLISSVTLSANQWNHLAVVRNGSDYALFLNGTRIATYTSANAIGSGNTYAYIGHPGFSVEGYTGYYSNVRLVNGSSVYDPTASSITVPTEPLTAIANTVLLTGQSNGFVDKSSSNNTLTFNGTPKVTSFAPFANTSPYTSATGASGYFDGTSTSNLSASDATAFDIGTGDFTIECWVYITGQSGANTHIAATVGVNQYWAFGDIAGTGGMTMYAGVSGSDIYSGIGVQPEFNAWSHLVWQRSSGTASMYLNGTRVYNNTYTFDFGSAATGFKVGRSDSYNNYYTKGYISNFRFVKGSAVYSGATITVPTEPLTAIAGTSLLLNFEDAAIYDAAQSNNLLTVADAQVDTAVTKFGTGSMKFDGTGDYLQIDVSDIFDFGTGDFTIEMWVYNTTNSPTYAVLWDTRDSEPDDSSHIVLNLGKPSWWYNGAARIQPATAPSINTWYHLAVAKSGTETKMFIDGSQVGSTYSDSNNYKANDYARIGSASDNPSGLNYFNGYIEDLRITKGLARYTSAFTPPTAAFPVVGE